MHCLHLLASLSIEFKLQFLIAAPYFCTSMLHGVCSGNRLPHSQLPETTSLPPPSSQ